MFRLLLMSMRCFVLRAGEPQPRLSREQLRPSIPSLNDADPSAVEVQSVFHVKRRQPRRHLAHPPRPLALSEFPPFPLALSELPGVYTLDKPPLQGLPSIEHMVVTANLCRPRSMAPHGRLHQEEGSDATRTIRSQRYALMSGLGSSGKCAGLPRRRVRPGIWSCSESGRETTISSGPWPHHLSRTPVSREGVFHVKHDPRPIPLP